MKINTGQHKMLVVVLIVSMAGSRAGAYNPPNGPAYDRADGLLNKGHAYITQNGISILNNDGYWFAAQMLQGWQQELLNGVRYADVYQGRQRVVIRWGCIPFTTSCLHRTKIDDWPLAADNHYFNPDTGRGFNPGALGDLATWADVIAFLFPLAVGVQLGVEPALKSSYTSALDMFDQQYVMALIAQQGVGSGIGGRTGTALAMFYLGWSSHFMQDLTVVHHTFDEGLKNHSAYEDAANDLVQAPLLANGEQMGIYDSQLPVLSCSAGSRRCFASYAAHTSHSASVLNAVNSGDFSSLQSAVTLAQRLQAGLYAAFLTDIGQAPVHMSAVMAVV